MKILHLIDTFDARFERDQIKLVELLETKRYRNVVITSRFSSDWRVTKKAEFMNWEKRFSQTEIVHAPCLRVPTPFSKLPLSIYLPSRQILQGFHIIHAYSFGSFSSFLGAVLKKMRNLGFVVRSDLSQAIYCKARKAPFYRMLVTYPFRVADAVYAYSNLEKRLLVDLGVQESRIWVIPAGIDFGKFSKQPTIQRKANITIGYLGRFCFVKGVHRVIPALQKLLRGEKEIKVVFTGIIEDAEYAKSVIDALKEFGNFEYFGDLSRSPTRFYDMCDIVLIPSVSETGAITVLEAMASGKVVIASDINPIKEYIQNGRTGFLFSEENDLYACLKKLIESPHLVTEIGERARKKAEEYDWQHLIRKYEAMYRSVMKRK
jgi:glycosyltransferase involved in cell wall biosynthesis